jgi:hypothetical protein
MKHVPKQSFSIKTPKDYLDKLVRFSYDNYRIDAASDYKGLSCAMFTWHLKDWLWELERSKLVEGKSKAKNKWERTLRDRCLELKFVEELVDGTKHVRSNTRNTISGAVEGGYFRGLLGLGTSSELVVHTNNEKIELVVILKKCLDFWESYLDEKGIT